MRPFWRWAADVSPVRVLTVTGLACKERIGGAERGVGPPAANAAGKFLGAGLGDDFDAAIAHAIELGGERILIHADFEDVGFGRNLAAFEAVDIDLAAIGAGSWPSQRLQLVFKLRGVVGECVDGAAFENCGTGIVLWIHADALIVAGDGDFLLRHGDGEAWVELLCFACDQGNV